MLAIGIAKVDITPEIGVQLMGYGCDRPAAGVHSRLFSTAIVFEQAKTRAAHVTLDLSQIDDGDLERLRATISAKTGIKTDHINIGVTHTHSGPQTMTFEGWGVKDKNYVRSLMSRVPESVADALERMVPVKVGIAETETLVGVNRRLIRKDNSVVGFGANAFGPYDSTMTVVRFESAKGPVATLIHASAHGTAMDYKSQLVSRDWMGVMVDRVEEVTGAPAIFINGSYGDTGPRMNGLAAPGIFGAGGGDGLHSVNEVGYRGATDALRAYESIKSVSNHHKLKVITENIKLPLAPLPDREKAIAEQKEYSKHKKDKYGRGVCEYRYWSRVVEALDKSQSEDLQFRQTIIALGSLALVPMPGEPFASITLRLRHNSPYQYTLSCGGTNGMLCYLPDRESRHRGGYETWVSIGCLTQLLADNIDDALVNENVRLLEKLSGHGQ